MTNQPLISVIIPVYNVALYLPRCLDSVCNQTYQNLEIILVDDGSTDNGLEICQEYAAKDKRVTVIHQKNGGLSAARNSGMEHMHGKFFTFIDSDDWIAPDYCQVLLDLINKSGADVSTGDYLYTYEDGSQHPPVVKTENKTFSTQEEILYFGLKVHHTAWLKLYRTATCGTLRFDPYYSLSEDLDFYFRLSQQIQTLACTARPLLYYYQRSNSLIRKADVSGRRKIFDLFQQIEIFCEKNHFKKCFYQVRPAVLGYGCILIMLLITEKPFASMETIQQMHTWAAKNQQGIFSQLDMRSFGHAFMYCFYHFPRLTTRMCRLPVVRLALKTLVRKRLSIG